MKKLLLLTLAFFLAVSAMGQALNKDTGINTYLEQQNSKYYYDPSSKGERLDSLIFEEWDEDLPGYVKVMREISSYGTGSQVDITYQWDKNSTPNKWINASKTETTFNTAGKITLMILYGWDTNTIPNKWVGTTKEESTYTNGKITLRTSYMWDGSQWANFGKIEYAYDGSGKLITDITSMWMVAMWVNSGKTEHSYDAGGNNIRDTNYSWQMGTNEWTVSDKTEYTFQNGKIATAISYDWDNTLPVPGWVNSNKSEYTYNLDGNMTSMSSYDWDVSQWVGLLKMETNYSGSNPISIIIYHWDKVVNPTTGWVYFSKIEQTASGSLPNGVKYDVMTNYDWKVNQWVVTGKDTYYYSDQSTSVFDKNAEKDIKVYPNPAKEYIIFDLTNISASAITEIYDIQGKKILEQRVSENRQISVSNLRKGLYFYKLHNNGTIHTGKILIE